MEKWTGSKQGKEYIKAVYCHPAYLTYMQSTSCEMLVWMKHKLDQIARRNNYNLRYADDTTIMAGSEEELKSLLTKVKEKSETFGLKLNIQKTKIMASVPSLNGKQMGKQWEQWLTLFLGAPKSLQMVIAAMKLKDACSLEEKL